jgi:hypothetical protein
MGTEVGDAKPTLPTRAVPFGSQRRLFGCPTSNAKMKHMAVTTKELGLFSTPVKEEEDNQEYGI